MKNRGEDSSGGTGDEAMDALLAALKGVHAQQARENPISTRSPERSIDDIAWNAVVLGHPNRFEEMPEAFAFAQTIAKKMRAVNVIPAPAEPYAPVVFSGLLNFLWRSQNLAYLAPDMAEGQAGVLKVATAAIAREWAPPTGKPWFKRLGEYPVAVDAALARIDALPWEKVYDHLGEEMDKLKAMASDSMASIKQKHPDATPGAMAWLMGTIMQKNTFSPLDGSVPEDIGEGLTGIYNTLESQAEGAFFPWLMEGYRSVREKPIDDLQKWKWK